jgi:hypothetical protein
VRRHGHERDVRVDERPVEESVAQRRVRRAHSAVTLATVSWSTTPIGGSAGLGIVPAAIRHTVSTRVH